MAHEMGHYVEKHIYFGIAGYILLTGIGLWLTSHIMSWWLRKHGKDFKSNWNFSIKFFTIIFINYIYATICSKSND